MNKYSLEVAKTANYYTIGELGPNTREIYFVIHGYGQLAEFFLKKFEVLSNPHVFIVAPEGLSRYYLSNDSGRVGASWMTKQSRKEEIKDHINYLEKLRSYLMSELSQNVNLNILAFSQGVATAYRWFAQTNIEVNNLIFWSGSLPDESMIRETTNSSVYFLHGDEDEYLHLMKKKRQLEILEENFLNHTHHIFKGKHELNSSLLIEINNKFNWI